MRPRLVPRMERITNWKPYGIGVIATVAIVAIGWALAARPSTPDGQRDDGYAVQVGIQNARVLAAQSMMAGQIVYYDGTIVNQGARTVTGYTVELTFTDVYGKPIERDRRVLLDKHLRPIPPHSTRDFEIGFDKVPDGWNQAPPQPRAVAVYVR